MGKILGRFWRILAWISPFYQFRAVLWRKTGINIGKNVYIGNLAFFDAEYPHLITIEDHVAIGTFCAILAHGNGSNYHQATKLINRQIGKIHIKTGAWIATGAIILPGVTIGKGSIVGAGAVISQDVPDYSVAVGNPARIVKKLQTS
ncbi:MAG: acyltransferase [Candidatus Kariarchaeaceae archaeon]|jgi:acetyltransferase-like isoleucine patch superfamily enzyme